ncbi:hypothetical protein Sjap_006455 [Stephania japonica]|uniref:Uncharacterized protein n=1 Tax=Stephania japonica TaxID=461633 RepID=A0AAP0K8A8_9MAGN
MNIFSPSGLNQLDLSECGGSGLSCYDGVDEGSVVVDPTQLVAMDGCDCVVDEMHEFLQAVDQESVGKWEVYESRLCLLDVGERLLALVYWGLIRISGQALGLEAWAWIMNWHGPEVDPSKSRGKGKLPEYRRSETDCLTHTVRNALAAPNVLSVETQKICNEFLGFPTRDSSSPSLLDPCSPPQGV